jgi:hypothetical protein
VCVLHFLARRQLGGLFHPVIRGAALARSLQAVGPTAGPSSLERLALACVAAAPEPFAKWCRRNRRFVNKTIRDAMNETPQNKTAAGTTPRPSICDHSQGKDNSHVHFAPTTAPPARHPE